MLNEVGGFSIFTLVGLTCRPLPSVLFTSACPLILVFSQGNKLSLAVLHPRKLVVYNVVAIGANGKMLQSGGTEQASYYDLNKSYEHRLERTAYNFCFGPFGGVYGKDFICVQSMDGQLSFLEQENFAFSRFLPNFLVPGPLCYVAKIDSFVTCNSAIDVECYKYHVLGSSHAAEKKPEDEPDAALAAAGGAGGAATAEGVTPGKSGSRIQCDWTIELGEACQSISVARYSRSLAASNVDILVLGEHTLFTLKENGQIRLQKRLDYNPSSCVAYQNTPAEAEGGEKDVGGANQNLIIATHQNSLMVYRDMQLVWAARTSAVPIGVRVATFAGVKGMIVTLSDAVELQISYLGTDPPMSGVSAGESNKELDYEAMDEEHRALLKVIKQASTDSMVEPKEKIVLRAQVGPALVGSGSDGEVYADGQNQPDRPDEEVCVRDDRSGAFISILVRLYVMYNGKADLENVSLALGFSPAFRCSSGRNIVLPSLRGGAKTPLILTLRFRACKGVLPGDLALLVVASYVTANNEPRTARLDTRLPLSLATRVVPPLKNCQYMFTLDTNRSPPALTDLFPDLLEGIINSNAEIARTAANVLTLLFHSSACDVTILVSKKSGRYRLQSSVFEALNLVSAELVARLDAFYKAEDARLGAANDQPPFQVLFKEQLPLHDYFLLIDKHFQLRQSMAAVRDRLERLAHQFRVIQKRLLVRYKDKNPAPLMQLDTLLHDTYTQIVDGGNEMSVLVTNLRDSSNQLSCATHLMLMLVRFKYDLDQANFDVLAAHLTPSVQAFEGGGNGGANDLGWEEAVDSGCTSLLRGVLAKAAAGSKDAPLAAISGPMEPLKDVAKLKRHIQIVCDRLGKGLRLVR